MIADDGDSTKGERSTTSDVVIAIRISKEDAERLEKALAEGKLKQLGITEMSFRRVKEPDPKKTWRQAELRKNEDQDKGALPLP